MNIPSQQISLIITFGQQSWVVLKDGSWVPVVDDFIVPDGVTQYTVQLKDINSYGDNIYVFVNDNWLEVPANVLKSVSQIDDALDTDKTITSDSIKQNSDAYINQQGDSFFFQTVKRDADELIAQSGFESTAIEINKTSRYQSPTSSDDFAEITVQVAEICTNNGENYNLYGEVVDVEDNNTVFVTVTDTEGNSKTFLTLVVNSAWLVENADLTGLLDGPLVVVANTSDNNGNPASASTSFVKDSFAEITIDVDTGSDDVINREEAPSVRISGSVSGVEDGQSVTITVTDQNNNSLNFSAIVINGLWQVSDANLSSLSDGELNYVATVTDLSCNTASTATANNKDTKASITILVDTNADVADNTINAFEMSQVDITGTVANVEEGQAVTVIVSDSATALSFNTIVIDGAWAINDADLSTLADGQLSYTAQVSDLEGNPATATTTVAKDSLASITVTIDSGSDDFLSIDEINPVLIKGTVTNIEAGQTVTIVLSNDSGDTTSITAIVTDDLSWSTSVDISSFSDGTITAVATANDIAGNPATAEDSAMKDTSDGIAIFVDTFEDTFDFVINAAEVSQIDILGLVRQVENGQTITVTVTDGSNTLFYTTQVSGLTWSIADADLSSLEDGPLTFTAQVTDIAGNIATTTTIKEKDTQASINVEIVSGDDDFLLIDEVSPVIINGTVTNIEAGQTVTVTLTNDSGDTSTLTAIIQADLSWSTSLDISSFNDGPLIAVANVNDIAGNPATASDSSMKDTGDGIAIFVDTFEDTFDFIINAAEVGQVDILGLVRQVEDGQTITVTVTDGSSTLSFTTLVSGLTWSIADTDLSSLQDGPLTFTAQVTDIAGNTTSATTVKQKDTQAAVTIEVDTNQDITDNIINAAESSQVTINGTVTNIEDGQTVTLTVTDGTNVITYTTIVSAQTWTVTDDLSNLNDGSLTYSVAVSDKAGNPANASTTTGKDTQAAITILIESGVDELLISDEISPVLITGTVSNIEANQTITIVLTNANGDTDTLTATVQSDLTWSATLDISSYADGILTAIASANDLAGNPATATDTAVIDTQVSIDIDTGINGINVADLRDNLISQFQGTTSAEVGQAVTLTVTDGIITKEFIGVVDATNHWQVNNINFSAFDQNIAWQISASVIDNAGNFASDDMPNIDVPRTNFLSETIVTIFGSQSDAHIIDINDASLSFTNSQIELEKITSEGDSVTINVASDGQSLELIRDGDGEVILTLELLISSVKATLYQTVDNPTSLNGVLTSTAFIEAIQTDSDGTSETIILPANLEISDSPAIAISDSYNVIENENDLGSFTGNDFTAEGPLKVTLVTLDGVDYVIPDGASSNINLTYGDLTVYSDGTWQFAASNNLDHTSSQNFELTYHVIDNDGSQSSAIASFTIEDGQAGSLADVSFSAVEPDLDSPQPQIFNFAMLAGSDTLNFDTIAFEQNTLSKLIALNLTSNGTSLTFTANADYSAITAIANGKIILTFTLSAVNNGDDLDAALNYSQLGPIDHILSDTLKLPLTIIAQDLDGTITKPGEVVISLNDGNDPQFSNITAISIDEADLISGPQSATASISTLIGSDEITNVAFKDGNSQPNLTAAGVDILYQVSPDGKTIVGYTTDINSPIFVVELSKNFNPDADTLAENYTFTLYQALDQDNTNDIPLSIVITDYDGDSSETTLDITVIDDDSAQITTPDLVVSEIPVDFSNAINIDIGAIISQAGTDMLADIDYDVVTGDTVLDSNGDALTRDGETIEWNNLGDGRLRGQLADGTIVFSVTVADDFIQPPATNNITFILFGPVDHITPQDDSLTILIPVALIDIDGTRVVDNMSVQIDDGLNPVIITPGSAPEVNEADLINNNNINTSGIYTINEGSDAVSSVEIAEGFNFSGVTTRGGINVSLASSSDSDGWFIATADDNSSEVFRIRFNTNNTYDYKQSQALDHALADGENLLTLNFDIQAIDADGDKSASQSLTIDIRDDTPEQENFTADFAEGDVINLQLLTKENEGADGAVISKITYFGSEYIVGDIILLKDDEDEKYAEIIINADGSAIITSNEFSSEDEYLDSLTFEVTDNDGDVVVNTLNITVRDNNGTIIAADHETNEDTPVELSIIANPGDTENGEVVTEIRINIASLNGGELTLDGIDIPDDGIDFIISGDTLLQVNLDGTTQPKGILLFDPAENTSDAIPSQEVIIGISVQIKESNNTLKPLIHSTIEVDIISVADKPEWDNDNSTYDYNSSLDGSLIEDGAPTLLSLTADLTDTDGSEVLSFRIENINSNLTLTYTDGGTKVVSEGTILTQAQLATLTASSALNSAGLMTFNVVAIATEQDNGDTIKQDTKLVSLYVQPEADKPEITVKNIRSDEDIAINANNIVSGKLNDLDGSEILTIEFTLPTGWSLSGINGAVVTDLGAGKWSALFDDISANNIQIIPLEDISSVDGTFTIDMQAVATEQVIDGIPVFGSENRSDIKTVTVNLKGVIDLPTIMPSADWSFDDNTLTITNTTSFNEDTLIPLDFNIVTTDDDGSETISLTITGFPDDALLVDNNGAAVNLEIVGFEAGLPVYSVTADQLQSLFLQPPQDFSGKLSLAINAIATEPDGDSGEHAITLDVIISPVIDEDAASLRSNTEGIEDKVIVIDFQSSLFEDIDGSEQISGAVITSLPAGAKLVLDGSEYNFSGSLDLATLAASLGVTLSTLLDSGRLGLLPPEDASGFFSIGMDYTIIDTSPEGDSAPQVFSTSADISVEAEVDVLTRFEVPTTPLISTDGSAIDLTGLIGFTDDDIDGSEVLDYVVLFLPSGDDWLVTHPNGALPDGNGKWLIPIDGSLTSNTIQENNVDILAGVTILSKEPTQGPVSITIGGRVIDEVDRDSIFANFDVQFDVAVDSDASATGNLQTSTIDGVEDEVISLAGHLDTSIAGDSNDNISFRILAADLPNDVRVSGAGVQVVHYANGRTVYEYLFTKASLASLTLSSAGEDFAGVLRVPIRVISTDSISGDTLIDDSQILEFEITPVVDGIELTNETPMQEDVPESLDLGIEFLDNDLLPALGGKESIQIDSDINNNLTITLLNGGTIIDDSGYFVLKPSTSDTWQFTGTTQAQMNAALAGLSLLPEEHVAGTDIFRVQLSGNIIDSATLLSGKVDVIDAFSDIVTISVEAVTDPADLNTSYSEGDEDSAIDLSAISAQLIDQDGSETMYLTIQGVPTGAILASDPDGPGGAEPIPLPNNGVDGGSFNGQPTYSWTVTQAQLASLVLIPPLDFNGDIPLTLQAITKDEEPGDYVTTTSSFIVGVKPIGDGVDVFTEPNSQYTGNENQIITIDLGAISEDSIGDEQIQIKVHIDASSDPSALVNIAFRAQVEVDGQRARFIGDGAGGFVATLTVNNDEISSFDLQLGNLAWGTLNMSVDVASVDTAVVNGVEYSDTSPIESYDFTIELTPEVDAPRWLDYDNIAVSDPNNIALNLALELRNPAPGEEGFLTVSGLLPGLTLSNGTQVGNDWLVALADVSSLSIIEANLGDNFDLILTPYAELDGDTETGAIQTINIDVDTNNVNNINNVTNPNSIKEITTPEQDFASEQNILVSKIFDDMLHQTQGVDTW